MLVLFHMTSRSKRSLYWSTPVMFHFVTCRSSLGWYDPVPFSFMTCRSMRSRSWMWSPIPSPTSGQCSERRGKSSTTTRCFRYSSQTLPGSGMNKRKLGISSQLLLVLERSIDLSHYVSLCFTLLSLSVPLSLTNACVRVHTHTHTHMHTSIAHFFSLQLSKFTSAVIVCPSLSQMLACMHSHAHTLTSIAQFSSLQLSKFTSAVTISPSLSLTQMCAHPPPPPACRKCVNRCVRTPPTPTHTHIHNMH